jgi:hypothetical protein
MKKDVQTITSGFVWKFNSVGLQLIAAITTGNIFGSPPD